MFQFTILYIVNYLYQNYVIDAHFIQQEIEL